MDPDPQIEACEVITVFQFLAENLIRPLMLVFTLQRRMYDLINGTASESFMDIIEL